MRAELIRVALARESNRYLLTHVIAKATRKLHRPRTRVPDTMNDVLALLAVDNSQREAVTPKPASIQLRQVA
jgi:hypothetical protein